MLTSKTRAQRLQSAPSHHTCVHTAEILCRHSCQWQPLLKTEKGSEKDAGKDCEENNRDFSQSDTRFQLYPAMLSQDYWSVKSVSTSLTGGRGKKYTGSIWLTQTYERGDDTCLSFVCVCMCVYEREGEGGALSVRTMWHMAALLSHLPPASERAALPLGGRPPAAAALLRCDLRVPRPPAPVQQRGYSTQRHPAERIQHQHPPQSCTVMSHGIISTQTASSSSQEISPMGHAWGAVGLSARGPSFCVLFLVRCPSHFFSSWFRPCASCFDIANCLCLQGSPWLYISVKMHWAPFHALKCLMKSTAWFKYQRHIFHSSASH